MLDQIKNNSNNIEKLSIFQRKKIESPGGWVSIYHETNDKFLPSIDRLGLKEGIEKNIGSHEKMQIRNKMIDNFRTDDLVLAGVSRNNIFGYPFLDEGHGLLSADQRYMRRKHDRQLLKSDYEMFVKYNPDYLKKLGVKNSDEYFDLLTSKEWLRKNYPGEILEIKVDPTKCFVGDMEYITRISENIERGWKIDDAIEYQSKEYWNNSLRLDIFLKWYHKPEYEDDGDNIREKEKYAQPEFIDTDRYYKLKGAPEDLPKYFYNPEIMITTAVDSKYIRVLE